MSPRPTWFCLSQLTPWLGLQFEGLHSAQTGMTEQDYDSRSTTQMIEY